MRAENPAVKVREPVDALEDEVGSLLSATNHPPIIHNGGKP